MYRFRTRDGTEAGLRIWIAFILGFWLTGFRAELAIFLGAIGGLATWVIVSYWEAEKVDAPGSPAGTDSSEAPPPSGALGRILQTPAERFRRLGAGRRLPRLPERKPPKRL